MRIMKKKEIKYILITLGFLFVFSLVIPLVIKLSSKIEQVTLPLEDGSTFYYIQNGKKFNNTKFVYDKIENKFYQEQNYEWGEFEDVCLIQELTVNEQSIDNYYVWKETYWDICDGSNYGKPHKEHYPKKSKGRYVSNCMVVRHELSYSMNKYLSVLRYSEKGKTYTYTK